MEYKWEVEGRVEVYRDRPVKRYLITTMGGYFPVLQKLQNGDLIAIVRGGDYHMGERGRLDIVRSKDGGVTWSATDVVVRSGPDDRNPGVIQLSNGTILVAFMKLFGYVNGKLDEKRRKQAAYITKSFDNGHTWTADEKIPVPAEDMISPYGKMLELPDKTILMPIYGKNSYILRSRNMGETWGDYTLIAENFNETALLYLPSGKLIAMLRSYEKEGAALWQADSYDLGYSWSEPRKISQCGEHPGDLLLLKSGKILLTYGHRLVPFGVRALLSQDEGQTWYFDHKITLAADCRSGDCGYPSSVQLEDGTICTAYYSIESLTYNFGNHAALIRYREEDVLF